MIEREQKKEKVAEDINRDEKSGKNAGRVRKMK